MRIVAVPAELFYRERVSKERARPVAERMFPEMIAALTRPLSEQEANPRPKDAGGGAAERIEIKAGTLEEALEALNEQFLANQWTDGLPIYPATRERVEWMLGGTTRSPDEVLGTIAPRNGIATIEKVAINAVMAGAKPEYLPVIIAAVEGLADPGFNELHFATSTGSFDLVIGVSGPIAEEIAMNAGLGLFSYGTRANSAIGRAVRMALINLGHTWPGVNDMALVGRPGAHAFRTFAENQALSPWTSHHEAEGFRPEDSTVRLVVTGSYGRTGTNTYGGGAVALVPPERILESIIREIGGATPEGEGGVARNFGSNYRNHFVIFNPEVAQELHGRLGYTRESLQQYLFEASSVPFEELSAQQVEAVRRAVRSARASGYMTAEDEEAFEAGLRPRGKVPALLRPEDVDFMVAGGIPGYTITFNYFNGGISKPIYGAALTEAGRGPAPVQPSREERDRSGRFEVYDRL